MSSLNATNASFIVGFIVLVSSPRDTASQHCKGRNISVTCLSYSANHWIAGQTEHTSLLRTMSFVKIDVFSERRSLEEQE